jgi:hypothetical protein
MAYGTLVPSVWPKGLIVCFTPLREYSVTTLMSGKEDTHTACL